MPNIIEKIRCLNRLSIWLVFKEYLSYMLGEVLKHLLIFARTHSICKLILPARLFVTNLFGITLLISGRTWVKNNLKLTWLVKLLLPITETIRPIGLTTSFGIKPLWTHLRNPIHKKSPSRTTTSNNIARNSKQMSSNNHSLEIETRKPNKTFIWSPPWSF